MSLATNLDKEQQSVTHILAEQAAGLRLEEVSDDAVEVAKQCVLDWFAVTLPGAAEPLADILTAVAIEDGGAEQSTLIGRGMKVPTTQAALVNGAAGHALDYDDVNHAAQGHPTAPVLPAVLALAEHLGRSGRDLLTAFIAGYETTCRVGLLIGRGHYEAGFHGTATIGSLGAAAGAARLLELSAEQTAIALGIAATQAAGLKSMFGTMTKPFHAGNAAANGVLAARLAGRGYTAADNVLEAEQGFASALSGILDYDAALTPPSGGFHVRNNLFKYHAACYLTHSPIEAACRLRAAHDIAADDIDAVRLSVRPSHFTVCNIPSPTTGLECKFSLRQTVAFAFAGVDTAALESYGDENACRPDLVALRERVTVEAEESLARTEAVVRVRLRDGSEFEQSYDVGIPAEDVAAQETKVRQKFDSLVVPLLGADRAAELAAGILKLEDFDGVASLVENAPYLA